MRPLDRMTAQPRGEDRRPDPLEALGRLLGRALEVVTQATDGRVEIPLPDGLTRVFVGSAPKSSGPTRLYVGALLPPDGLISAPDLSRAFGGGSVVRNEGRKELHQFSPYGPADVQTNPRATTDWFVGRITAAWDIASEQSSLAPDGEPDAGDPTSATEDLQAQVEALEAEAAELRERVRSHESSAPDDKSGLIRELQREVEALRRDRDETQQLLVVADREAADLKSALRAAEQAAKNAARAAAEAEAQMVRPGDHADGQSGEGGSADVSSLVDEMSDILELALRDRVADKTTIAVLERAHRLSEGNARLAALLARRYLDVGRPVDAIQTLTSQAGVEVSPVSAALMVEAHLTDQVLPEPTLIERADWEASSAADLLKSADWLTPDAIVGLAPALAANPFTGLNAWFGQMADRMPVDVLPPLFEAWRAHDPEQAICALLAAVERRTISADTPWVVDGLRGAFDISEESTVGQAIAVLLDIARRSDNVSLLHELASVWRRRLTGSARLVTGVRLAIAQADLRAGSESSQAEAQLLVDLYWDAKRHGDEANLEEILALVDRTKSTANAAIRSLLEQCRRPEAIRGVGPAQPVSNVSEALEYVSQKYPKLVVLREARDSARQRGASGYKTALTSLEALGRVARDYAADNLHSSVQEACRSLAGFREDVSDSAKQQYRSDYERRLPDGRIVMLGAHINGGLREGRIYFYIDEKLRRIVIGHVGKHLRGAQDS